MNRKLYVGNLNYDTTEETLKETFEQFGEVVSVN
ncbi:MAG: RNA-binding protein, partial [Caldiserica bacterium]